MRFMQLLCEGHNTPFQTFLCEQDGCPVGCTKYNVLQEAIGVLDILSDNVIPMLEQDLEFFCSFTTSCLDFICEAVLGPCLSNQMYLSSSELPHILEALYKQLAYDQLSEVFEEMRKSGKQMDREEYFEEVVSEVTEVKGAISNLVLGLLEGADSHLVQTIAESLSSTVLVGNVRNILSPSSGLCFELLEAEEKRDSEGLMNEATGMATGMAIGGFNSLLEFGSEKEAKESTVKTSPLLEFISKAVEDEPSSSATCKALHGEALACFVILRYLESAIGDQDENAHDALLELKTARLDSTGQMEWHPDVERKLLAVFCNSCEIMRKEGGHKHVRRIHFASNEAILAITENAVFRKNYTERFESVSRDNASAKVYCATLISRFLTFVAS